MTLAASGKRNAAGSRRSRLSQAPSTGKAPAAELHATLALLACLLLGACADGFDDRLLPPEVALAGLRYGQPGLFEQQLYIDLRVRNPNDVAIDADRLRFELEVNGRGFADGWSEESFALPPLGSAIVPVTVRVSTTALVERMMALGTGERLEYRLHGEVELDHLFMRSVPFERTGKLVLPPVPEARPRSAPAGRRRPFRARSKRIVNGCSACCAAPDRRQRCGGIRVDGPARRGRCRQSGSIRSDASFACPVPRS